VSLWYNYLSLGNGFWAIFKKGNFLAYYAWSETSSVKVTREKRGKCTAQPVRAARRSIEVNRRWKAVTSRRYGNCLTASNQGACTAQPVRAATRFIEGNGRGEAKKLAAPSVLHMAQEIVSRHKHNMLSLLYATCLKLLVFFLLSTREVPLALNFNHELIKHLFHFYGCEMWLFVLNTTCLRNFKKKVIRRISELQRELMTERHRKLYNEVWYWNCS